MSNRRLPAIVLTMAWIGYTLLFLRTFPMRGKDALAERLTSADAAEIWFYSPGGSNVIRHVHGTHELARLASAFEKSILVSLPSTKYPVFGRAMFSRRGDETLRMEFASLPLVAIGGQSYAISPEFTLLVRAMAEEGRTHE